MGVAYSPSFATGPNRPCLYVRCSGTLRFIHLVYSFVGGLLNILKQYATSSSTCSDPYAIAPVNAAATENEEPGAESNLKTAVAIESPENKSARETPSTSMYPSLPTSVTMPTYPGDRIGESLTDFSEAEWKEGRQAYPADFLNLLRDDGHVHVFAPREKAAEYLMNFGERRRRRHRPKRDLRIDAAAAEGSRPILSFAELVRAITDLLNEDKEQNEGVKIHISVRVIGSRDKHHEATTVISAQ
ncbi:hypothetical protein V3C99_000493 [Haemonchus contortus]